MKALFNGFMVGSFALFLADCGDNAVLQKVQQSGPTQLCPRPHKTLIIPTVNIAPAKGWPAGVNTALESQAT